MNNQSIAPVHDLLNGGPALRTLRWLAGLLLRVLAVLLVGVATYYLCALSVRLLISFDCIDTGTGFKWPLNYGATLFNCLGPLGWLVGGAVFFAAWLMAMITKRWPWPVGILLAVAPPLFLAYNDACVFDLHCWVRPVCVYIALAEAVIAAIAAVVCRLKASGYIAKKCA